MHALIRSLTSVGLSVLVMIVVCPRLPARDPDHKTPRCLPRRLPDPAFFAGAASARKLGKSPRWNITSAGTIHGSAGVFRPSRLKRAVPILPYSYSQRQSQLGVCDCAWVMMLLCFWMRLLDAMRAMLPQRVARVSVSPAMLILAKNRHLEACLELKGYHKDQA